MENPSKQDKPAAYAKNIFIIGSQIGSCPICRQTKKLLLLRFGLTLCDECLLVCMNILEQIEFGIVKNDRNETKHCEITEKNRSKKKQSNCETPNNSNHKKRAAKQN